MPNHDWWDRAANVPGAPAVRLLSSSDPVAWAQSAPTAAAAGGRLLAFSPSVQREGFVGVSLGSSALADLDCAASVLDAAHIVAMAR